MAGLRPLYGLLDWFEDQLRPATDRAAQAPPQPPARTSGENHPPNTLARALWEALEKQRQIAQKEWEVRMARWEETEAPYREYDFEKIEKLVRLKPIAVSISSASSTKGYLAFVFDGDQSALECPAVGNALYFFHANWRSLALESKQHLIRRMKAGDHRIKRLVHGKSTDMASRVGELVGTRDFFGMI